MCENLKYDDSVWELNTQEKNAFTSSFEGDDVKDQGHDDLFDSGIYRTASSTFRRQGNPLQPKGQTAYRVVDYDSQGLPDDADSSHGKFVYGMSIAGDGRPVYPTPAQQFLYRDPTFVRR
jgi:hypothetical protein